ncbi:MAG TPA: cell wall hydrolase [Allosphingosinicella sp.]|nr:cell wall hydrolase [Allosphingosinicella sp.]
MAIVATLMASSCVPPSGRGVSLAALQTRLIRPLMSFWRPQPLLVAALAGHDEFLSLSGKLVPGIVPVIPARPYFGGASSGDGGRAAGCLAAAVYYEARSEGEAGQRAVAQVVLNRVRHYAFPSTICGVVFQGSSRRSGCQFSFTCDGSMGLARDAPADRREWERAKRIAAQALAGYVHAPVGHATHYHTGAVSPAWAPTLQPVTAVGSHLFYRWRGGAGEPDAFSDRRSLPSSPGETAA